MGRTYSIRREPLGNLTSMVFTPSLGSQELEDALQFAFPFLPTSKERHQEAIAQFLAEEQSQKRTPREQNSESTLGAKNELNESEASVGAGNRVKPLTREISVNSPASIHRRNNNRRGRKGPLPEKTRAEAARCRGYACEYHRSKRVKVRRATLGHLVDHPNNLT
jgi:hypothetical protein